MFTHPKFCENPCIGSIVMNQQVNTSVGDVKICTMVPAYTGHKYVQSINIFYLLDK